MSPGLECNSDLTGPAFTYTEVPLESPHSTTRMIRLLPNKDNDTEIECELFNYDLTSGSGADSHLYEALSYDDLNEKTEQIPLMRTIYAQAQHVTVWLEEAYEDGDKALEGLQCLAEGQDIDIEGCGKLCVDLFRRAWFRRIWVLQEVGVARHIYIMCGFAQINEHAFCEGLKRLGRPLDYQEMIGPIAFLIKRALVRPKFEFGSQGTLTIGELVGMYCYHNATEKHDKIYALLGLSAEPPTPALTPNYAFPWDHVFRQVINHIFPECSVKTWPGSDIVIIRGLGWALGHICSVKHVSDFGQQKVKVYLNDTARLFGYESQWEAGWELQTFFAQVFSPGDVVFLLQGASRPSIIRLCNDHLRIITPAVTLCKNRLRESLEGTGQEWHTPGGSHEALLVESWREAELLDMAPAYQEQSLEAEYRRNNITRIMAGVAMGALALKKPEYEDIAHLLVLSGTDDSIASRLTKASAKNIRRFPDTSMQSLFSSEQDDLSISEEMVTAVAENDGPCGYKIMELLFQLQGSSLPISEEVVEAAAGNSGKHGDQVMKTIYRHRGEFFPISEEVVKAAAGNTGIKATKILKLLLKAEGEAIPISGEVLKAAAGNRSIYGFEILKIIVHHRGQNLPVSEDVIINAMKNYKWGYDNIHYLLECCDRKVPVSEALLKAAVARHVRLLRLLIEQGEESLPVSEEVVKAAAGCVTGNESLELLLQYGEKSIPISEEVIKVAAGNEMHGDRILEVLFQYAEGSLSMSEEVIKVAAGNIRSGDKILALLFQHAEGSLSISEEVVKAAARNEISGDIMLEILFQQEGKRIHMSEEVVKTAAQNEGSGPALMEFLFQQKGDKLPVTEEVVKAAAENEDSGHKVMEILIQQKGERLPVTEEVVKKATGNKWCGHHIMELLFQQRGKKVPVTEEVLEAAAENTRCGAKILEILQPKRSLQTTVTESPEVPEISESAERSDSSESSESSLSSDELGEEDQSEIIV
ncbi:uncharacterized protein BO87DRAFT_417513 [Aspergillus neoniger CBS 115656]|uniref:Heterokaryon incompatibility domain-containing protein n=1 Tax=Aspergillus neoniger (strain CBS 115656) TaxID=1448310 RepID=A0A318YEL7_ASPNB|nr:hypothetical protein BO87DRAFT_417513 [Aspergillus neoniger CBS 115656]PYH32067.1 hypothetical protein BO87DRAFT_417513 [Aspergillus neoniger CBS 115656]